MRANALYDGRMLIGANIPTTTQLLKEIDRFLTRTHMSDSTFGRAAVGNAKFLPRLREGIQYGTADVKLSRLHQIIVFMEDERARRVVGK